MCRDNLASKGKVLQQKVTGVRNGCGGLSGQANHKESGPVVLSHFGKLKEQHLLCMGSPQPNGMKIGKTLPSVYPLFTLKASK